MNVKQLKDKRISGQATPKDWDTFYRVLLENEDITLAEMLAAKDELRNLGKSFGWDNSIMTVRAKSHSVK